MIKAAKGGQVSRVNGQEYIGGQFMPEHGEFCGTGRNRITSAKMSAVNSEIAASPFTIRWNDKYGRFELMRGDCLISTAVSIDPLARAAKIY